MKFGDARNAYGNSGPPDLDPQPRRVRRARSERADTADDAARPSAQASAYQARRGPFAVTDLAKANADRNSAAKLIPARKSTRQTVVDLTQAANKASREREQMAGRPPAKPTSPARIITTARKQISARPTDAIKLAAGMKNLAAGAAPAPGKAEDATRAAGAARAKYKGRQVKFTDAYRPVEVLASKPAMKSKKKRK